MLLWQLARRIQELIQATLDHLHILHVCSKLVLYTPIYAVEGVLISDSLIDLLIIHNSLLLDLVLDAVVLFI
jgi:hypothetical protein